MTISKLKIGTFILYRFCYVLPSTIAQSAIIIDNKLSNEMYYKGICFGKIVFVKPSEIFVHIEPY